MHKGEVHGVLQAIISFVFAAYCLDPYTCTCIIDHFTSIVAGFRPHQDMVSILLCKFTYMDFIWCCR
jgi:hypothetical protein